METLLTLSFDNISSRDTAKISKGIRQIEGVLAQICVTEGTKTRLSGAGGKHDAVQCHRLDQITADPAFREFFRLQESFQWNVATRLIDCLERLLGMPSNDQNNRLISQMLELLLGILLLHPPSRILFRRDLYMNVLLDLLDIANPAQIQSQALLVLVSALLATPANTRTFEKQDGLLTVASLFKAPSTSKEVKMKAVEFFYFYLMPECSPPSAQTDQQSSNRGRKTANDERNDRALGCRTTDEKQQMLGKYLHNVAELVQDLREAVPICPAAC